MVKYTAKQPNEDGTKRQRDSQRLHSCIDAIRLAFKGGLQDLLLTHQSYCSSPHTAIRFAANIRLKKLRRTLCMTDTAANEIAPHLPLLFENEANGILQDPIGAGIVLYVCHMGLALTGTGFYSFAGALIFFGPGWNFLYLPLLQQHSVLLKKVWLRLRNRSASDIGSGRSVWSASRSS